MKFSLCSILIAATLFSCNKADNYGSNADVDSPRIDKRYGGLSDDNAASICIALDGGYLFSGSTSSNDADVAGNHGGTDGWIVKLDRAGNKEWQKAIGGTNNDFFNAMAAGHDGSYVFAGNTSSSDGDITGFHGAVDVMIAKVADNGDLLWQRTLGGSGSDRANAMIATIDGGYIFVGATESVDGDVSGNDGGEDAWVVKLNQQGDIEWQRTLGGSRYEEANSISRSDDGCYIIAGYTYSNDGDVKTNHGSADTWLVKLNSDGEIVWERTYGGSGIDAAISIVDSRDGGFVFVNYTNSNDGDVSGYHGSEDAWVVKIDRNGDIVWEKAIGGSGEDHGTYIRSTDDNGYILTAYTTSNDGDVKSNRGKSDAWVVRFNEDGSIRWKKVIGGVGVDAGLSIIEKDNKTFVMAGFSHSDENNFREGRGERDAWVLTLEDKWYGAGE